MVNDSNSTPEVDYSILQAGGYPASSPAEESGYNLTANPLFVSPVNPGAAATGGNYRLGDGSPAVNTGTRDYYPGTWAKWSALPGGGVITQAQYTEWVLPALSKDAGGDARIRPSGGVIDRGAYERQ
jgi:hypothetical protein